VTLFADESQLAIPGLIRIEQYDRQALGERLTELTHSVYPHHQVYGEFCTVQGYIACPPEQVFAYMSEPASLVEWTYSVRKLRACADPEVLVGVDSSDTPIYVKTVCHAAARTVDYHCAWDQGRELWMIYLNRIVPAELVLKRPGSVLIWTNCRHPYYDENPHPELCKDPERPWVGDWWPLFYAGHTIEFQNLKAILEYRYERGIPVGPHVIDEREAK
jgi:hypothetical protein